MSTVEDIKQALGSKVAEIKSAALKVIAREARDSINKNFEQGGRPVVWKPSERARKKGGKTLIKSGNLMRRINIEIDEAGSKVKLGSTLPYARIHQEGGSIQRKAGTVMLRTTRSGATRFAGAKHKKKREAVRKGHVIKIEPRPFLVVPETDYPRIIRNVKSAINNI